MHLCIYLLFYWAFVHSIWPKMWAHKLNRKMFRDQSERHFFIHLCRTRTTNILPGGHKKFSFKTLQHWLHFSEVYVLYCLLFFHITLWLFCQTDELYWYLSPRLSLTLPAASRTLQPLLYWWQCDHVFFGAKVTNQKEIFANDCKTPVSS